MYENALHLGITSEQQDVLGESYTELMGSNVTKNLDWKTPNGKTVNVSGSDFKSKFYIKVTHSILSMCI